MVMSTLTDKRFLIGLVAGYLVIPRVVKHAMPMMSKLKGGA